MLQMPLISNVRSGPWVTKVNQSLCETFKYSPSALPLATVIGLDVTGWRKYLPTPALTYTLHGLCLKCSSVYALAELCSGFLLCWCVAHHCGQDWESLQEPGGHGTFIDRNFLMQRFLKVDWLSIPFVYSVTNATIH